jgi:hypothetical protein
MGTVHQASIALRDWLHRVAKPCDSVVKLPAVIVRS